MNATIIIGKCEIKLRDLAEASVDAIVTDPPYELGFMGKAWDSSGIAYNVAMWSECLRVLKPGGYLLSFGGSRTYHRMACAIEDAGFEIRDQIMWIYGSGFPKSLDVSKAIDKAERGVPQGGPDPTSANHGKFKGGCSEENTSGRGFGAGPGQFMAEPTRKKRGAFGGVAYAQDAWTLAQANQPLDLPIHIPVTDAAKQWDGWGTALKPAHEPIVVARKPLTGTVAANVLEHGTGALNIDACRIEAEAVRKNTAGGLGYGTGNEIKSGTGTNMHHEGRWPANVIHDGSEEVTQLFPETASAAMSREVAAYDGDSATTLLRGRSGPSNQRADSGSAARFFYTAKADKEERESGLYDLHPKRCGMMEDDNYPIKTGSGNLRNTKRANDHPTVKPVDLMCYLVRLVTPPGGTVLDPFTGSGSTGIAALREGFNFIGIEEKEEYAGLAERRMKEAVPLFAEVMLVQPETNKFEF